MAAVVHGEGRLEIVDALLAAGVDVNACDLVGAVTDGCNSEGRKRRERRKGGRGAGLLAGILIGFSDITMIPSLLPIPLLAGR